MIHGNVPIPEKVANFASGLLINNPRPGSCSQVLTVSLHPLPPRPIFSLSLRSCFFTNPSRQTPNQGTMADLLRESAIGQIIRFASRNRYLQYPEEDPNFHIPWEEAAALEKEKEIEADFDPNPPNTNGASDSVGRTNSRANSLTHAPTAPAERTRTGISATITRTRTREQTLPYSAERLDVEREESIERTTSSVIQPQQTADGIILIDWYTTDDPANPQNWSSGKKAYVTFQIFIYTFAVYAGSAIYTSSEPQVMEVFGVGQSKASLGLSLYVIGYGIGPMLFSPLSEIPLFGRNVPYLTSFALFVILCVPTALVEDYAGLLVLRFLTGFMGSPCLATGGATMGDIVSNLVYVPFAYAGSSLSLPLF
jgi:MFS transporter, DHA1 family, multidrug resistance protein